MLMDDLNYELPEELIAQTPAEKRDQSRLMVMHRKSGLIEECRFAEIIRFLHSGDLLVINNAKVLKARLFAKKVTGGKVELLLLDDRGSGQWEAMIKPAKRVKVGTELHFSTGQSATVSEKLEGGTAVISFGSFEAAMDIMEACGELPLPPYIHDFDSAENHRYQTVFASEPGAVAAPTAGLHLTPELISKLKEMGVEFAEVTLNVGAGTFLPLRSNVIEENNLHSERYSVSPESAAVIDKAIKEKRRIIPVGTTSMRVLESLGPQGFTCETKAAATEIFIYPGIPVNVAGGMITNFHLPGTSLLCLVAAFAGVELMKNAYKEAVRKKFRFYSFGDAMLIID